MTVNDFTLTQDFVKECFDYNNEAGVLIWKKRSLKHFNSVHGFNLFNNRFAGKVAGSIKKNYDGKTYSQVKICGNKFYTHRVVFLFLYGYMPVEVDHENGNGIENTPENLRSVSSCENGKNVRKYSNNKSGCTGVCWCENVKKWKSFIQVNKKPLSLGYYFDWFDAVCARKSAEWEYKYHKNHGSIRPL